MAWHEQLVSVFASTFPHIKWTTIFTQKKSKFSEELHLSWRSDTRGSQWSGLLNLLEQKKRPAPLWPSCQPWCELAYSINAVVDAALMRGCVTAAHHRHTPAGDADSLHPEFHPVRGRPRPRHRPDHVCHDRCSWPLLPRCTTLQNLIRQPILAGRLIVHHSIIRVLAIVDCKIAACLQSIMARYLMSIAVRLV